MSLRERHTFTVTAPSAALTGAGVEKTAVQGEGAQVVGLIVPLDTETAMRAFGITTRQPFQMFTDPANADLFVVGGQVTAVTLSSNGAAVRGIPSPLYVLKKPEVFELESSVNHCTTILDTEIPRTQQSGSGLGALTGGAFGGGF